MKSFEELKQQDQVDAEEALKLSMEEHLKATGNVHNLKASEIGSTLPQWNANKILGNPVRFVSDKDGNTLQYNEKEQSFDLKPTPKLEFLGEGDIKVSKVGEKVVIKSDISKSDTVVGLKHTISTKAPSVHEHKDYVLKGDLNSKLLKLSEDKSSKNHSHNNYVTFPVIEKLKGELDKSLEIGLSKKAERNHKHDLKIPTFKKEFGKIEKDINTLQEVVGVVGDKSNLATKADLKIAVSEVVSLPVKKHEHTDYAKVIEIDKLKKTITELKIVDKKGNNKVIEDLLAYKAERNHAHTTGEISGLTETLSGLGSTYLKIDGSNSMTSTTKITNLNADLLDDANLSIDGTLASNSDILIPSEKAVRTFVGASLVLGSPANGLTLTGTTVKTLSLPTTAAVKLASLNVNSSSTPSSSQIYIPQGAGGASAPGIKFIPTDSATTGGLSMYSGIAEFWNNWDSYTTPQAGKMRGFFRLDSRTGGYEAEAFNIGGYLIGGSNYQGLALNFSTGDAILCGYELGSVGVGRPMSLLGVSGKNGWLATQYTVKVGGGLIMKYLAKTANYTLTETDYIVDCTTNSFAITLPSAVTWAGQVFVIKNSGTGVITLNTTSSQTIDGNASGALTLALQYDSITVMSNGANWIII